MIYYKRYMGDYARKTKHLNLVEHGIYTLLLDFYYSTDILTFFDAISSQKVCKIVVGARTTKETQSVSKILDEFFPIGEDGKRHNSRADQELATWERRAEINRNVGKLGGRPAKKDNPNGIQNKTQMVLQNNPTIAIAIEVQDQKPESVPDSPPIQTLPKDPGPIFGECLSILCQQGGLSEKTARSFLALQCREFDEKVVVNAVKKSVGKAQITSYIVGILKNAPKKGESGIRRAVV